MEPITNFSIFKRDKKPGEENRPDYSVSAKVVRGNTDSYEDIGAGYIKESSKGTKFISIALQKDREFGEKKFDGYCIITTKQYNAMKQAWDDWQIKLRNPGYPTPTEVGIDLQTPLVPDPAFDITPEMLDVDPKDIPF